MGGVPHEHARKCVTFDQFTMPDTTPRVLFSTCRFWRDFMRGTPVERLEKGTGSEGKSEAVATAASAGQVVRWAFGETRRATDRALRV